MLARFVLIGYLAAVGFGLLGSATTSAERNNTYTAVCLLFMGVLMIVAAGIWFIKTSWHLERYASRNKLGIACCLGAMLAMWLNVGNFADSTTTLGQLSGLTALLFGFIAFLAGLSMLKPKHSR